MTPPCAQSCNAGLVVSDCAGPNRSNRVETGGLLEDFFRFMILATTVFTGESRAQNYIFRKTRQILIDWGQATEIALTLTPERP